MWKVFPCHNQDDVIMYLLIQAAVLVTHSVRWSGYVCSIGWLIISTTSRCFLPCGTWVRRSPIYRTKAGQNLHYPCYSDLSRESTVFTYCSWWCNLRRRVLAAAIYLGRARGIAPYFSLCSKRNLREHFVVAHHNMREKWIQIHISSSQWISCPRIIFMVNTFF